MQLAYSPQKAREDSLATFSIHYFIKNFILIHKMKVLPALSIHSYLFFHLITDEIFISFSLTKLRHLFYANKLLLIHVTQF